MAAATKINSSYHHTFLILENIKEIWQHPRNFLQGILFFNLNSTAEDSNFQVIFSFKTYFPSSKYLRVLGKMLVVEEMQKSMHLLLKLFINRHH